ncbi:MAG: PIF1 family ATP-dependent DNA helicase [Candidatus Omnitrophota bacterium]
MNGEIDFNEQFARAFDILENTRRHVFITGQAGTGKSTLLEYFRNHTSKNVAVLAPTGVAAINVKGQTIHSFFRFKPDITPETVQRIRIRKEDRETFENLDAIIIDEVSMVRADLLDCVDQFLRKFGPHSRREFGGVQMILLGDLYQLPPVVRWMEEEVFRSHYETPYFFSAKVLDTLSLELIDLFKIYRQVDDEFIELLNAIRHNRIKEEHLKKLNNRFIPDFIPDESDFFIYLTTTNAISDAINIKQLKRIHGEEFQFQGRIEGSFDQRSLPTKEMLQLRTGSQVMLLNNDPEGRWVNGSIGKTLSVTDDLSQTPVVKVELENGHIVEVGPFTWEMFRFNYNHETQQLESESIGSFMQYPLKLAWAVTIHKSQGKTFSKVILDIGSGAFAHGQIYVALSRCVSLDGIVLRKPIAPRDVILDPRIVNFMASIESRPDINR